MALSKAKITWMSSSYRLHRFIRDHYLFELDFETAQLIYNVL